MRPQRGRERRREVTARVVVNATGPWVTQFLRDATPVTLSARCGWSRAATSWCRSSSRIASRTSFRTSTGRIVFAIPYEEAFTLIGTTDVDITATPRRCGSKRRKSNTCATTVNRYFSRQIAPARIVAGATAACGRCSMTTAGEASNVTRDYSLELDERPLPLLSVFGGKITTYRKLAETAVDKLEAQLGSRGKPWTKGASCPAETCRTAACAAARSRGLRGVPAHCGAPLSLAAGARCARATARAYGTRIERLIGSAHGSGRRSAAGALLARDRLPSR